MRTRSLLRFSSQGVPQTLTVAVVLFGLFTSTIWEPAWAAESAAASPSASGPSATAAPARADKASKPAPPTRLPDVPRQQTSAQTSSTPNLSAANQMLQGQGPVFIENRGQFDSRVKFLVKGNGANFWLTNEGIVFDFQRSTDKQSPNATEGKRDVLKPSSRGREGFDPRVKSDPPPTERLVFTQKVVSANSNPSIEARDPQPGIYNYFIGSDPNKWRTHVLAYKEVVYRDIWKGIDLKLFANGPNLEEEFIVHPGADASEVQLAYEGIKGLAVADDGSLQVATAFGGIVESSPRIYQEIAGKPVLLSGSFKVGAQKSYTFEVAKHDEHSDLIIDPTVIYSKQRDDGKKADQSSLLYYTFLGGSAGVICCASVTEFATGIAVDAFGSAYVTGTTGSTDFPTTPGAYLTTNPGGLCGFVTKFTPLGKPLQYSTYLCNVNTTSPTGIGVDSSGEAYVIGTGLGFPTTSNALQQNVNGAFMAVLSAKGDTLLYSTGFGTGTAGYSIAVDSSGKAYFTGEVARGGSIPITANAFQSSYPSQAAGVAFLGVLDPSQSGPASLVYGSYLGGSTVDVGQGVAVDAFGMAYLGGSTSSQDFPVTAGAFQTTNKAIYETGFVTKFNPYASSGPASVLYSTYLGGSYQDEVNSISVDSLGNTSIAGYTRSVDFPTTPGSLPPAGNSSFVTKLNAAGNKLVFSTYWGGTQSSAQGVATDILGNTIVAGYTRGGLLVTQDAFQSAYGGNGGEVDPGGDAFISKFDSGGTLIYSSYLGGLLFDVGRAVAVDSIGDAYIAGYTGSVNFPTTPFAFQPQINPGGIFPDDAFVTKFPLSSSGALSIIGMLPDFGGNAGSVTPQIIGTGFHNGATAKLACGQTNVPGSNSSVSGNGQILTATYDLTQTAPGVCDVVVTNADMNSAKLSNGFTVQQGGAPDLRTKKWDPGGPRIRYELRNYSAESRQC